MVPAKFGSLVCLSMYYMLPQLKRKGVVEYFHFLSAELMHVKFKDFHFHLVIGIVLQKPVNY